MTGQFLPAGMALILGAFGLAACGDGGGGITVGTHAQRDGAPAPGTAPTGGTDSALPPTGHAAWWFGLAPKSNTDKVPAAPGRAVLRIDSATLSVPASALPAGVAGGPRIADLRNLAWMHSEAPLTSPADLPLVLRGTADEPLRVAIQGQLEDATRRWALTFDVALADTLTLPEAPADMARRWVLADEARLEAEIVLSLHACALAEDAAGNGNGNGGGQGNGGEEPPATAPATVSAPSRPSESPVLSESATLAPAASDHAACAKAIDDAVETLLAADTWRIVGTPPRP